MGVKRGLYVLYLQFSVRCVDQQREEKNILLLFGKIRKRRANPKMDSFKIRDDNSNNATIELSWAFCKHNVYLYFSQLITESNRQLIFLGPAAAAAACCYCCCCWFYYVYAGWSLTRNSVEYQKKERYGNANIVNISAKHPLFKYR